jgi:hypothetical protein
MSLDLEDLKRKREATLQNQPIPEGEGDAARGFKDVLRSALGQGLALGFGDEIEAFVTSKLTGEEYKDVVKGIRKDIETFKKESPILAGATELAGGLITGGAGLGKTALTTAARSAGLGAGYGAGIAEGDLEERAKSAAVSGAISGALGGAASKFLPKLTPEAQALQREGVELTPGQALSGPVGGVLRRTEETASSLPALGTGQALQRSTESFNKAVFNRTLKKIDDEMPKNISIEDAPKVFTDKIIDKLNQTAQKLEVKNINKLQNEIDDFLLDQPITKSEVKNIKERLGKFFVKAKNGKLSGPEVQKMDSFLNRQTIRFSTSTDALQREMGDIYSGIYNKFSNYLINNNPKQLVKNYQNAKSAYGDFLVISKAGTRGAGDTLFTPRQLLAQSRGYDPTSAKRKTFVGEGRLQDIGRLGERVLGREIPESGTIPRALTSAALLGGGAVVDPVSAGIGAGILGAYQTPGTQRALLELLRGTSAVTQRGIPMGVGATQAPRD